MSSLLSKRLEATRTPGTRILSALMIVLLIAAIGTLIFQARNLQIKTEEMREARADNLVWLVTQLEVDLLKLERALLTAEVDQTRQNATTLRQNIADAFDIFYSRVALVEPRVLGLGDADIGLLDKLTVIKSQTVSMADLMDGEPALSDLALISRMKDSSSLLGTDVRAFSLDALQVFLVREKEQRTTQRALLGRFASLALLLVVLLSGLVVIIADLYRDLAQRAAATRRAISNLERMIEASRDAVVAIDAHKIIQSFNSAAEKMFGHSRSDAIGKHFDNLLLPKAQKNGARLSFPKRRSSSSELSHGTIVTGRHANGQEFLMEAVIVSDHDSDGEPIHFAVLRDVSAQIAVEATLRRTRDAAEADSAARARFLAVISHEMRTPLNGVMAALDLLARNPMPANQNRLVGLAQTSGQMALQQVEDLLDLTRREEDAAHEPLSVFSPVEIARSIADQARALASEKGNRILIDLPSPPPGHVLGLRRSFERALGNLLSNAVKFTSDGVITIRLSSFAVDTLENTATDNNLVLSVSVSDEGVGIAPEYQSRIFEDFETLDTGTRHGTGLGLGIARRAVRAMNGSILVESALGKGSTFRFSARVRQADGTDLAQASPEVIARPTGQLHILLAEDNSINRILMHEMLSRLGHTVVSVPDGKRAVELSQITVFDLVVLDVGMPVLDGLQAAYAIRSGDGASSLAPILAVTAQMLPDEHAALRAAGVAQVLTKPIRFNVLSDALMTAVAVPHEPLLDRQVIADASAMMAPDIREALILRFIDECHDALQIPTEMTPTACLALANQLHAQAGSAAILGALRLRRLLCEAENTARDVALGRAGLADITRALESVAGIIPGTRNALVGTLETPVSVQGTTHDSHETGRAAKASWPA